MCLRSTSACRSENGGRRRSEAHAVLRIGVRFRLVTSSRMWALLGLVCNQQHGHQQHSSTTRSTPPSQTATAWTRPHESPPRKRTVGTLARVTVGARLAGRNQLNIGPWTLPGVQTRPSWTLDPGPLNIGPWTLSGRRRPYGGRGAGGQEAGGRRQEGEGKQAARKEIWEAFPTTLLDQ